MFGGHVRRLFPCSAGLSVTFLCPDSFEFYATPICSRAIPLSVTLVPCNTLFMAYRPNVNGPCHCLWCLNSLHVLGPTIGGSHGPGRYYLFNICPPFRLTYNHSALLVVGSIALERVLSLMPPLLILYHRHLQPYHFLRRHPPSHPPPSRAQGNGFQSCVFVLPTASSSPIMDGLPPP
jgi:hypothetical protein